MSCGIILWIESRDLSNILQITYSQTQEEDKKKKNKRDCRIDEQLLQIEPKHSSNFTSK